jgi:hypothetical protein
LPLLGLIGVLAAGDVTIEGRCSCLIADLAVADRQNRLYLANRLT